MRGWVEKENWDWAQVHDSIVGNNIIAHLVSLRDLSEYWQYISVTAEANNLMRNLFSIETYEMPEDFAVGEQESLIE